MRVEEEGSNTKGQKCPPEVHNPRDPQGHGNIEEHDET